MPPDSPWRPVLGDAQARRQAVDAGQSVLVQAPAGSGKTTLLTQRFLQLLARVASPERILALTFTRRAAQEMRSRVIEALNAATLAQCPQRIDPATWTLARAAQEHLQSQGVNLLQNPARLRIETIDSFNAWLAAQLPVSAGAGGRFVIAKDATRLYEEAAARALAHAHDSPFFSSIDHALELNDERWPVVRDLLASMLPARDGWLPILAGHLQAAGSPAHAQLAAIRSILDEDLSVLIERALLRAWDALGGERIEALTQLLGAAAQRLEPGSALLQPWRQNAAALRPVAAEAARWRDMAEVLLTDKNTIRKAVNKTQGFAPLVADKSAMTDLLAELEGSSEATHALAVIKVLPDAFYSDEQWQRVLAVSQTLVIAAAELQDVFRESGESDFTAVSMAAMRALGTAGEPTDLGLRLDYSIDHLLVDEFQDTSNAQLDLFKLMTAGWQRGDGRTFFCVGDPMQSIYGFREAEVRAFLELAQDGLGDVYLSAQRLTSNFRAQRPLVDWINHTFSQLFPRSDDRDRGAIAYTRADAQARDLQLPHTGVHARLFCHPPDEAAHIAKLLSERLQAHPDWRIAILVRTKRHAEDISRELQAHRLPFRALEIGRMQDRPVVSDIIMLTRALVHLADRTAWFALLRSPCVGLELSDLWMLGRSAGTLWQALSDADVLSRLTPQGRVRAQRVHDTLRTAFGARDQSGLSRWVERTWMALGAGSVGLDAQDLACARAAFARLEDLDRQGFVEPTQLEDSFERLFAADAGEQPIEIMTIHKAKGLEFDMVVVPRLDATVRSSSDDFLQQHSFSRGGRPGFVLAARAATGQEADPLFEFLRWQERDSARLETERLLYVACTRAKYELWLTANKPDQSGEGEDAGREFEPRAGSLLKVLWPFAGHHFESVPRQGAGDAVQTHPPSLQRLPLDFTAPVLDSSAQDGAPLSEQASPQMPPFDWASETARQIGILVHGQLQTLHWDGGSEERIRRQSEIFERWFASRGVPHTHLKDAVGRVIEALLSIGNDPKGRWILARGYAQDARELALSSVIDGRIVKVILDRSFVDQGVRWIIDYKTSQHVGGELERFLDNEVLRYRVPMERYARIASRLGPEPIRLGLYFPLMRAWREWPADIPGRL